MIISLVLMLVSGIQSCAVAAGGSLASDLSTAAADKKEADNLAGGGGIGVLGAFMWLIGAALVLGKPKASAYIFGTSALVWLIAGTAGFSDAFIWSVASLVFAVMSHRGIREKARKDEQERARYQADVATAAAAIGAQGASAAPSGTSVPPPS